MWSTGGSSRWKQWSTGGQTAWQNNKNERKVSNAERFKSASWGSDKIRKHLANNDVKCLNFNAYHQYFSRRVIFDDCFEKQKFHLARQHGKSNSETRRFWLCSNALTRDNATRLSIFVYTEWTVWANGTRDAAGARAFMGATAAFRICEFRGRTAGEILGEIGG